MILSAAPGSALAASQRDPFYIEGHPIGFDSPVNKRGAPTSYKLDFEFGYHPSNRHDEFVIGVRQGFYLPSVGASGFTAMRLGYDIPILVKGGRMEVTIAPYGLGGINYSFEGNGVAGLIAFGIEGRFFPIANNGFFATGRPFEIDIFIRSNPTVTYAFMLGAGYAF